MKIRMYKCESGEVVVDTPSQKYQEVGIDKCPHPWRFRDSNPDKEEFTMEIIDYEDLKTLAVNNEAGSAQFYHENGKLKHDNDRSELLMGANEIKSKHYKRLTRKIDEELDKNNPDPVKLIKFQRDREKVKDLTDKEAYQIALTNLDEDGLDKPKIRAKLNAKINE